MQAPVESIWLTTAQAAGLLNVDQKTLWAYVGSGLLVPNAPNGRGPGKRVYFDADEIRAFAKRGANGAAEYRRKRDGK